MDFPRTTRTDLCCQAYIVVIAYLSSTLHILGKGWPFGGNAFPRIPLLMTGSRIERIRLWVLVFASCVGACQGESWNWILLTSHWR